jgi:AraC-like DNA-binding protein
MYAFLYDLVIGYKLNKYIWHKKGSLEISKEQNSLIKKWSVYLFILLTVLIIRYFISFVVVYNTNVSQAPTYGIWVNSIFWIILLITILSSPEILYGYSYLEKKGLALNSNSINISNWNLISKEKINYSQDQALKEKMSANIENYIEAIEISLFKNNYFRKPEFTIRELALALNIPISHLKYLYKYHSKISFSDHKKIIRIKDALKLIDQNYLKSNTLESLSKEVGFASYNPFFTSFKEVVGKSPVQYLSTLNGYQKQ